MDFCLQYPILFIFCGVHIIYVRVCMKSGINFLWNFEEKLKLEKLNELNSTVVRAKINNFQSVLVLQKSRGIEISFHEKNDFLAKKQAFNESILILQINYGIQETIAILSAREQ